MTRAEFEAFWLPRLNETAKRHGVAPVEPGSDLDGLWFNYLAQQDGGLQERANAVVANERAQ